VTYAATELPEPVYDMTPSEKEKPNTFAVSLTLVSRLAAKGLMKVIEPVKKFAEVYGSGALPIIVLLRKFFPT
jgi:hypothetical protein